MKLAQFRTRDSSYQRLGVRDGEKILDVSAIARAVWESGEPPVRWLIGSNSTIEVIKSGTGAIAEIETLIGKARALPDFRAAFSIGDVEFLPPINPGKILAIGRNYIDHAIEGGAEPPKAPLIFNKLANSLSAHNAPIVLPSISKAVDYEAELAVVIGRSATKVSEADALDYVFGYTLMNDVTARDLQYGDGQWTRGKGLDGFAPLGPFITTRDEIDDVHDLKIEGRLNGEVMQTSNTSKMIFRVAHLISYISQGITLDPGDIISTGTPDGVGYFRKPPVLLKDGDVFEVEIEKLGVLRNPVIGS